MSEIYLVILIILNYFSQIICINMPCSVQVLQKELRGIPCNAADIQISQSKLLSSYININTINKITITGWFYLENT